MKSSFAWYVTTCVRAKIINSFTIQKVIWVILHYKSYVTYVKVWRKFFFYPGIPLRLIVTQERDMNITLRVELLLKWMWNQLINYMHLFLQLYKHFPMDALQICNFSFSFFRRRTFIWLVELLGICIRDKNIQIIFIFSMAQFGSKLTCRYFTRLIFMKPLLLYSSIIWWYILPLETRTQVL